MREILKENNMDIVIFLICVFVISIVTIGFRISEFIEKQKRKNNDKP